MFKNPIIIFGRNNLLKSIQKTEPQEFLIWSFKPLKVIDEKDRILSKNISSKIDNIIFNIQNLQKLESITSTITLTSDTLSKELKIPRSHVEFLFKYYCYYSINDFSNLLKVNYAVSLIKEGYLEKYTVASLGEKCLFNSRFTFSKNFKKFIGVSVSYFVRTYANRNDNIQPQSV
jgi:AraC-like DNA-binding protein